MATASTLGGFGYSRLNVDLRLDNPHDDHLELRNKLFVQFEGEPRDNLRAVFSILAEHNTLTAQETRLEYSLQLYEAYVRLRTGDFDLFVGKQIADWGMADASVVNNLNPSDLSEFITREDEFLTLPVTMIRGVYYRGDHQFEVAYVPFYKPSRMDFYGSDWAMVNGGTLAEYRGEVDADAFARQGVTPGIDRFPDDNFVNGTIGGRWVYHGLDFDYQLSLINGWELFPLFEFNPEFIEYLEAQPEGAMRTIESLQPQEIIAFSPLYESRPIRQTQLGGGIAGVLGESTTRAELAVITPQELYTQDLELTRHTIVAGTAGIDRFLPFNVYANLSYLGAYISDYPQGGLMLLDQYNHYLVGILRGSYLGERFTPEIRGMANLGKQDFFINPRLPYRVTDDLQLTLGMYLIQGDEDTMFGQFSDNSFVYTQARYAF